MAENKQALIGLRLGKVTTGYETTNFNNWPFVFTILSFVKSLNGIRKKVILA